MAQVNWDSIGNIIGMLLVLSVLFEQALTPIFNWRIFAEKFEGKGVKTPFTLILAFLLFWNFDLNIFKEVMLAFGKKVEPGKLGTFMGCAITSFLIAGGSGGIFNLYTKLNIRNPAALKTKAKERHLAQPDAQNPEKEQT